MKWTFSVFIILFLCIHTSCCDTTYCKGADRGKFLFMMSGPGMTADFTDSLNNKRSFNVITSDASQPSECERCFLKLDGCECSWNYVLQAADESGIVMTVEASGSDDVDNRLDDYDVNISYSLGDFWNMSLRGRGLSYDVDFMEEIIINGRMLKKIFHYYTIEGHQRRFSDVYVDISFGIIAFSDSTTKTTFLLAEVN